MIIIVRIVWVSVPIALASGVGWEEETGGVGVYRSRAHPVPIKPFRTAARFRGGGVLGIIVCFFCTERVKNVTQRTVVESIEYV